MSPTAPEPSQRRAEPPHQSPHEPSHEPPHEPSHEPPHEQSSGHSSGPARGAARGATRGSGQRGGSLRWWVAGAVVLLLITVLVLPLPLTSTVWIVAVLMVAAVFTVLEVGAKGRALAAVMIALLALYLAVSFQRAVILLGSPGWITTGLGVGMLVLPAVGVWAAGREILFGARVEKLGRTLAAEGDLPADDLPRTPSGRIVRDAADRAFEVERERVEAAPEDWRGWYRLGVAYAAAGDTRRGRSAMRTAVGLSRSSARVSPRPGRTD